MQFLNEAVLMLSLAVFVAAMIIGAASDLHRYEIPDQVSIAIVVAFLPAAWAGGLGLMDIAIGIAIGVGCMIVGIGLFAINMFGGGDVKLLAAGAVWAGWEGLPVFVFLVAIAGGILSLALILFRRFRLSARLDGIGWIHAIHTPGNSVPYGVAIAAGALMSLPRLPITADLLGG